MTKQWYPVFVRDESSVKELNALFEDGWFLNTYDLKDLPFLGFEVPISSIASPFAAARTLIGARLGLFLRLPLGAVAVVAPRFRHRRRHAIGGG